MYTLILTITNSVGRTETFEEQLTVAPEIDNVIPQVDTRRAINFTGPSDLTVDFDLGDPISGFSYELDFGDGNTGTGSQASHTYDGLGTYTVKITVRDENPDADPDAVIEEEFWFTIWDTAPEASFTMTNLNEAAVPQHNYKFAGDLPLNMSFDASASTSTGDLEYQWDFGDGNTDIGEQIDHTYSNEGFYLVTLTVTDEDTELTDTSQAFVQAANYYIGHEPTIKFNYPEGLGNLALDLSLGEEDTSFRTTALETLRDHYPYVVYLNPSETPLESGDTGFVIRHAGFPCSIANPESGYSVYINGSGPLGGIYSTLRDSTTGLCRLIVFKGASAPTIGNLLSSSPEAEIRVVTFLQDFSYDIDVIAGVRVPRVFVTVVPDSMIEGNVVSPQIKEYTANINGTEELMLTVSIRESELTDFVEFEVPVYAVDKQDNLAGNANGYFHAEFLHVESDCGDCVMVDGKSYVKVKIPLASGGVANERINFNLSHLRLSRDGTCGLHSLPSNLRTKSFLSGCVTLEVSNEVPLNAPPITEFQYELLDEALAVSDSISSWSKEIRDPMWEWLRDIEFPSAKELAVDALPFFTDGKEMFVQIKNGLGGQGVEWPWLAISVGGFALDFIGAGELVAPIKLAYKISREAAEGGGSRLFADSLDEAVNASLATNRSADGFIDDVRAREPEMLALITAACPRLGGLDTSSLSTQAAGSNPKLSEKCLTGVNNISGKLTSVLAKEQAQELVTDNVTRLATNYNLSEELTEKFVTDLSKKFDDLLDLNFTSMSNNQIAFEQLAKASEEAMTLGITKVDGRVLDLPTFRHRTCVTGGNCTKIVYDRNLTVPKINGKDRYSRDYRDHLKRCTGIDPYGKKWEAHHIFPQKFFNFYDSRGPRSASEFIDSNNPNYLVWWESSSHGSSKNAYNDLWEDWFVLNPNPTVTQLENAAKGFMQEMANTTGFSHLAIDPSSNRCLGN